MSRDHRIRWELDPASSEDYRERVREYDAYRAGDRFRAWVDRQFKPPVDISTRRKAAPSGEARGS